MRLAWLTVLAACGNGGASNSQELITRVTLAFTPSGGGTTSSFKFDDPDGDGGSPPTIDHVMLAPGSYNLTLKFENTLEDPPEDITLEIADEAHEHQVFLTGTAIDGPAASTPGAYLMHAYADMDTNLLPIGLANTIVATVGSGRELGVTLRHMPPVNGVPTKAADTAMKVKTGAAIGGETDVGVTFFVTVQ